MPEHELPVCLHDKDIQRIHNTLEELEEVVTDTIEENINLGWSHKDIEFLESYKKQISNVKETLKVFRCGFGR